MFNLKMEWFMHNYIAFILSYLVFIFIHEGIHMLAAYHFSEFGAFTYNLLWPEVIYKTPIPDREGLKWGIISGLPNIITIIIGYVLFYLRKNLNQTPKFSKSLFFYLTTFFLLFDAFNLSIGPFIYGGDIGGVSVGFNINQIFIQIFFFILLLINREIIIQKVFPAYQVKTNHFLFRPIIKK